jgi:P27 family predicted phage terminase small subunit
MSGPKPIPTQLKLLRGNPGKQKLSVDVMQPEQAPGVPDPPPFITGYAAEEWWIVAVELHNMGVLTRIDLAPLSAYCHAYGQWRMAAEALARVQDNDPVMSGMLVKSKYGVAIQNPLVYVVRKAASDMVRYAGEFGLTPAARSRIAAGVRAEQEESKFAGLLAG